MIKGAIAHLMTPAPIYQGGPKVSPIQATFYAAVDLYARTAVAETLAADVVLKQAVDGMIAEAITRITTIDRDPLVKRMAEAISRAITGDRY